MKTKILIVDDLRENIIALQRLIEASDVEIHTASSPDQALDLLLDHDFGLALLDVQMPTMTGFELARLIRGVHRSRDLPIIFVTAQAADSGLIFEGYESGAVDVLFKPLDPHIVRAKVRVFVRLDQQSRLLGDQIGMMAHLKEEAESANIAKSRFLANMSHEIRTPLSAVLGFADVLSQSELAAQDRDECISSISRNGKLLLRIIDDILDLSRIEAQRLELEKNEFDLNELLKDLEATLNNKASDKGIALEFHRGEGIQNRFVSDPLRLKQILLNVIGNAIKFTHRGSVKVSADVRDAAPLKEIRFEVHDTGIGLSSEEVQKIFEPFAQADSSTRRIYGGTGLGLAISKQLARNLGGDVLIIKSIPGEGTTFLVSIRAPQLERSAAAEIASTQGYYEENDQRNGQRNDQRNDQRKGQKNGQGKELSDSAKRLTGKKILVVDDVIDNRTLIERYLRPAGIEVEQAAGGQEAVQLFGSSDWDAILMDIQMPYMDGYETTAQLRKLGFAKPIIALTAHAMREELDRCLRAGCDMTLTKPVAKRELIDRLADAIN